VALSIFVDKSHQPTEVDVAAALGRTAALWNTLRQRVSTLAPDVSPEWKFGGASLGWGFRLRQERRVVIYMTPCDGHFLASVVLGEKAIARARAGRKMPKRADALVDAAPRYAEGRGIRLPVRSRADVGTAIALVGVKLATD
jgi:uncharacterized protein DUF3788